MEWVDLESSVWPVLGNREGEAGSHKYTQTRYNWRNSTYNILCRGDRGTQRERDRDTESGIFN